MKSEQDKCAELDGISLAKKTIQGVGLLPCPKCGTHRLKIMDCGYSSFNAGHVECECGVEYEIRNVDGLQAYANVWNNHCKDSRPDYSTRDALFLLIQKCRKRGMIDDDVFIYHLMHITGCITEFSRWAKSTPAQIRKALLASVREGRRE